MARDIKYTKEQVLELVKDKEVDGIDIRKACDAKGWKYVTINAAMKRYGIKTPLRFARRKDRKPDGEILPTPAILSKKQQESK
jgi:hypothetical protein